MATLARATAILAVGTAGCGLRSDPLVPEGFWASESSGGDAVDPNRVGSCNDRLPLPTTNATVTGELAPGGSMSEGWCGDRSTGPGPSLLGPEDAYVLVPAVTTDVTIRVDPSTAFDAVLRVEQGGCGGDGTPLVCDRSILDRPFHFLAEAGQEYTVTIDSADGESGEYAFSVTYGAVPLELCPVHPEQITQQSGGSFVWNNTLSRKQGRVDGFCGGPGAENMFTLNTQYPGFITMSVTGSNGFSPVISLRSGCGATSEFSCARGGDTGIPGVAELEVFLETPGQYFIVVDQTTVDGGDYDLNVLFD